MSTSPSSDKFAQREKERENELKEAKIRISQNHQQELASLKEKHNKEIELAMQNAKQQADAEMEDHKKFRMEKTAQLANLESEIEATIKAKIALRADEGKADVENKKAELEKKQKELEFQASVRRDQLNKFSEILKNGEQQRQEALKALREERKKAQEEMNNKTLEMNQKRHETRIAGEERLQQLDERRNEEQKQMLLKKENTILKSISYSEALSRSLGIEDSFELFKQHCRTLIAKYRLFSSEFDSIESQLLKIHDRMKKGRKLCDCEMSYLLSALRVFKETAIGFSSAGSTDEDNFNRRIGEVIAKIETLMSSINNIKAKVEVFEDDDDIEEIQAVKDNGIGEELLCIKDKMKEMSVLIQEFNVIGRDHLQETLAIQMEQAQSSRHAHRAIGGPPAYDSPKKVPHAITDN